MAIDEISIRLVAALAALAICGSLPAPCFAEGKLMDQTSTVQGATKKFPIESRIFKGSFEHPKFIFQATFYIDDFTDDVCEGTEDAPSTDASTDKPDEGNQPIGIKGKIVWQLQKSPHANEQSKVGLSAIEYVTGKFFPRDGLLEIAGYAIDDPNKLNIALDNYALKLKNNGTVEELDGGTTAHTDGLGRVTLVGAVDEVTPPIVLNRTLNCKVEELWSLWTENEKLKKWLSEDAKVSTNPGAKYELFWEPEHPERNSTKGCVVLDQAPERELVFTWRGPVPFSDLMNTSPPPTYVRVRFQSIDKDHSKVELSHYGWGSTEKWKEAKTWQENAWKTAFDRMD